MLCKPIGDSRSNGFDGVTSLFDAEYLRNDTTLLTQLQWNRDLRAGALRNVVISNDLS